MFVLYFTFQYNFQDTGFLTFEPLTLIPFQTKLLDTTLLTVEEVSYVVFLCKKCTKKIAI